jgi:LuxR family transcriptional regulator, maltose regulon positive regulatory protein
VLNALIETKFHNPIPIGHLTVRPRLDQLLDESMQPGCRLVLVTAPAGFGKSTLVSAWMCKHEIPFTWLSLDSGDNEPRVFLSYLIGALQKIHPAVGKTLTNRIQTADSADSEAVYADILAILVNEIAILHSSLVLVLDDAHLLKNPQVLKLLNFLIEHQPAQLHLALLTREDLPLPIARLRVRRQVVEIRQANLQFTAEEAADFLREGMGLQLSPANISALEQRTEGWIAGLQLAALSLKYSPDPSHFIHSFTGSDRYILDYLLEEVFTHQPVEIQNFLLSTSILDRFCASLCEVVLTEYNQQPDDSGQDSQVMLELAERSNLFLIPLDNQRRWYRYHHLFVDLLRHALTQAAAKKIPHLHLRASQWLEANGFIQEAVKHAFLSKDWRYAAELVERHAWNMILHSQVALVSEWCGTFPDPIIRQRPALCIFHGWALIIAFKKDDFPAATVRIEQAEAALSKIDPHAHTSLVVGAVPINLKSWVTGQITLLRSFILMAAPRKLANPQALIDFGQISYDQLPPEDFTGRSVSLLDICYATQALSDAAGAEEKFKHVIEVASSGGNYFGSVVAEYHRAHGLLAQGKLREVISFCRQKRGIYEGYFEQPRQDLPAIALLDQAEGCALLEMNELSDARRLLRSGLEVGQWMPREELPGYLAMARLCAAKDDAQGMAEALRRLDMRWPDIHYCTEAVRLVSKLKTHPEDQNLRKAAAKWAAANPPEIGPEIISPGIGPAWNDEADYTVYTAWIQVQILLSKADDVFEIIQPMLEVAQQHNLIHRVIDLLLLQAQAFYTCGERSHCWSSLMPALVHAEREGYLRLADQGPVLVRLLIEAAGLGMAPRFIASVLKACGYDPVEIPNLPPEVDSHPQSGLDGLVEPISAREMQVLDLMAQGFSNAEIAARLYLSPNTMKTHAHNIFGKLGVHSRVQAINKARDLKII